MVGNRRESEVLRWTLFAGLVLAAFCLLSCRRHKIIPDQAITEQPTAADILLIAAQRYSGCDTYQDDGSVVTRFVTAIPLHSTRLEFTTAYAREGRFRYTYRQRGFTGDEIRYEIWKDHEDVRSWWTVDPVVHTDRDIGQAIAAATGVSGGSAYTIPSVLLKEAAWKGRTWTSPSRAYRVRDGTEGSVPCFRIQRVTSTAAQRAGEATTPATKGKITYWVQKDAFLLVRIDEEYDFGSFQALTTTKYAPRINRPIPVAAFVADHR